MDNMQKRGYSSLFIFLAGLLLTIVAVQLPVVRQLLEKIGQTGWLGSFIGGILYAFAFTSSLATVMFFNTAETLNPVTIALLGGLGALIYDLTIFFLVRRESKHGFLESLRLKLTQRHKIPAWLSLLVAVIILGSPLPDELAAGLLGFLYLPTGIFISISFLANTAGILIIALLR